MNITIEKMSALDIEKINLNDFDNFWTIGILRKELENPLSFYIVAKCENEIIGFAGLNFVLDEAHIANIVVKTDKRNMKVGSTLLEALIKKAEENSTLITLEVNEKNTVAIHLYQNYGFTVTGHRKKYYENQYDAYIMTKNFNTYD